MVRIFDRGLAVAVGLLAVLLVFNAGLSYRNTRQLDDDAGWVNHTHEVIDALRDVRAAVKNAESAQRGYLLTGEDAYLEPLDAALATVGGKIDRLQRLTVDNADQQQRLPRLRELVQGRLDELAHIVRLRKDQGDEAARKAVRNGAGERTAQAFGSLAGEMERHERDLMRQRRGATERAYRTAVTTGLLAAAVGLAAVVVVVWLGRRHLRARLKAGARLRHERELLQATLASIGDAVIVTDPRGDVTFLNPVAQALTGWGPREAAGQPLETVFRILNEETRRPVESPVSKVLRQGTTVGLANHTVLLSRDGREIPIDDSGAPIRGEAGAVEGVVLVFRDVTEARRAAETRMRLAAIVESSDDAIISKNLAGIIVSWNEGAERLYGYTAEEVIGKPLSLLLPPDSPDEMPAIMERLKRGERVEHFETVRVSKDGRQVIVSLTISPVRNAEGKIVGASKVTRDITSAKRTEAALRFLAESSKLLADLRDVPGTLRQVAGLAVPHFADWCAVDLLEPDGTLRRVAIAHADPARAQLAQRLHDRYPPDPAAPRGAWNVLRTGRPELLSEIPESLLTDPARDKELTRILRELGLKSYMGVPLSARGKALGVLTFVTAESGRRYDAADLRLAEDLGQRAGVAIDNARLYGALKDADRRKDEFLAMLSHELRNPLAPIRNALHVMKMPGANGEAVEQARQMTERQVLHMVRLVDDLLDVSRIMRGRIDLRKEPVELAAVIAHAAETAQPQLDAQGQELVVRVPAEPLQLEADPARLAQVVANLLNNAAKFSERPGRVWLTAERQGGEAVVSVRDEGVGIRPDLVPHVFDLFVQGDRSLERSQGGLGIGLTVVRKLVELHGGTVTARSEGPGRGSEFVVHLPGLRDGPGREPAEEGREAPPVTLARRVLVVDDNVDAAVSVAMLLRHWGHEVRLAHNGPEALHEAEAFRPQVVLLDIGLPGMNGYEVAKQLRSKPEGRDLMLVAVTGYGQEEDRHRTAAAGFDHHLTKPVDLETLKAILRPAPAA